MAIIGEGGEERAAEAVRGGADFVQVRAKHLSARDLLALARSVIDRVGDPERVIVNSRADVARLAGAAGVHLPEYGLDPADVRRAFPGLMVGASRHDRIGIEQAERDDVDYVLVGPVFATPGKEHVGAGTLSSLCAGLRVPVVVVGGMSRDSIPQLAGLGLAGVAAIRPFERLETSRTAASDLAGSLSSWSGPGDEPLLVKTPR